MTSAPCIPVDAVTQAKFRDDGSARRYPGNTFVTRVAPDGGAPGALAALARALQAETGSEAHRFLPPESFHMTLFRGVNDSRRLPEEWPQGVALDAPLSHVTDLFVARLQGLRSPSRFLMKPDALVMNAAGDIQLRLRAADEPTATALEELRQALAQRLRHHRPRHGHAHLHITLSYRVRPANAERNAMLGQALPRHRTAFETACPQLWLEDPALCRYDDMLAFTPVYPLA